MLVKAVLVACLCTCASAFQLPSQPAVTFGPRHRSSAAAPLPHSTGHLCRSAPAARMPPVHMQQFNLPRGGFDPNSLIGPAIFAGLFFSGALGWIFNFVIGIQLLLFLLPVVGVPLFQWYVKQNLLEGRCPTCSVDVQTFKGQTNQCMQCGTVYTSELVDGMFLRQPSQTGEGV